MDGDGREAQHMWRSSTMGIVSGVVIAIACAIGLPVMVLLSKPAPGIGLGIAFTVLFVCMGGLSLYTTVAPMAALSGDTLMVRNWGRTCTLRLDDIAEVSPSRSLGVVIRLKDGKLLGMFVAGGRNSSRAVEIRKVLDKSISARRNQALQTGGEPETKQ